RQWLEERWLHRQIAERSLGQSLPIPFPGPEAGDRCIFAGRRRPAGRGRQRRRHRDVGPVNLFGKRLGVRAGAPSGYTPSAGFTLIELLVVLVIAGVMLGMVALNAMPGERQVLQTDAQRIALLFQLARDEAIVRNRPIAFEAFPDRYRFLIRERSEERRVGEA